PKCNSQELIAAYKKSCEKHSAKPLNKVIQQLETFSCSGKREEKFVLKGEKIDCKHCETLEEIFRRVQFKNIDLESCHLDDECAVALFDMIEYYDSACTLNISFNKNIGLRGWQACSRLIRRTPSLATLDMRNCDLNDRSIPVFGRALKLGSHLTVLHMENMYLSGRALIILVAALKMNEILQELFLADNRLMPSDGIQLGNLLKYNHTLALLDLRNNHLQDVGVGHMTHQSMASLSRALGSTKCLETLNLGHNNVTNEGIHILKDGLLKSKSLMRLGLQSTRLTCEGAVALAEYVADSLHLLRLDLRENDIKTAGLMALSLALKVNDSVTRLDVDKETKKESGMKDYADQQRRLQQEINGYLERNQKRVLEREEEERRLLEERAQVQAAKQEVKAVISSAQELLQANPEMLFKPSPEPIRRPSLLFDAAILTPQESLESPHCSGVHPLFPPVDASLTGQVVVPKVSVSSPPMSLELQHPLTASSAPQEVTQALGGDRVLPMPLPPTLSSASVLPSPPVELLLSPQYYPKPTARKIFSVSRVVEASPVVSPTVSKTGFLDAGCPPVRKDSSSLLLPSSSGVPVSASLVNTVSPTLLCQDLAVKTVNTIIEQLVADVSPVRLVPPYTVSGAAGENPAPGAAPELAARHAVTEQNQESSMDLKPEKVSGVEEGSPVVGGDLGVQETVEGEDSVTSQFDPLGVLQAPPTQESKRMGMVVSCDSLKASLADASKEAQGDIGRAGSPVPGGRIGSEGESDSGQAGKECVVIAAEGCCVENTTETVTSTSVEGETESLTVSHGTDDVGDSNIPVTRAGSSSSEPSDPDYGSSENITEEVVTDSSDLGSAHSADELLSVDQESATPSEAGSTAMHIASGEAPADSEITGKDVVGQVLGDAPGDDTELALARREKSDTDIHPTDSLLLVKGGALSSGLDNAPLWKKMDLSEFGLDDDDLSLFGAMADQTPVRGAGGQPASQPVGSEDSAVTASASGTVQTDVSSEVSAVLSDTWLTVDAPSVAEQRERPKGGSSEPGPEDKPDFFTALTFNGLTQELASALSSIDESGTSVEDQELHTPDEFERELDAMLASVKNDLPWPLQQDSSARRDSEEQSPEAEGTSHSSPTSS
ncbi:hypothetical protein BaRGS_00015277, partial [Batillaria attramentaria]